MPPPHPTPPFEASVVLPAYNEELGVDVTLKSIADVAGRLDVVVVDDGSTDRTAVVAAAGGARVVRHRANRGKGAAFRTGVAAAESDLIVTMDADATYPAGAIPRVIELLGEHDYVSAARRLGRSHIPAVNRLGNAVISRAIRLLSGSRLEDPLTGMYGLRRSALDQLKLRSDGFGLETEIAIKAARLGLPTAQLHVSYGVRAGRSKLDPVRDGVAIARTIIQVAGDGRFRRRRPVA